MSQGNLGERPFGIDFPKDNAHGFEFRDAGGSNRDAEPGLDKANDGRPLRRFLYDLRQEASSLANVHGAVVGKRTGGSRVEYERFTAQFSNRNDTHFGERMARRENGDERFAEEFFDDETVEGAGIAQKSEIDGAVAKCFNLQHGSQFAKT